MPGPHADLNCRSLLLFWMATAHEDAVRVIPTCQRQLDGDLGSTVTRAGEKDAPADGFQAVLKPRSAERPRE
jgi:hypothetical protein